MLEEKESPLVRVVPKPKYKTWFEETHAIPYFGPTTTDLFCSDSHASCRPPATAPGGEGTAGSK